MSTGRWRERRLGQFASRTQLQSQRRALLAPVQRWHKEWVTISPSSKYKVCKWVRIETAEGEEGEEQVLAAAAAAAQAAGGSGLAGLGAGESVDTPTPSANTPAGAQTPGASLAPSVRHPLANSLVPSTTGSPVQSSTAVTPSVGTSEPLLHRIPLLPLPVPAGSLLPTEDIAPMPSPKKLEEKLEEAMQGIERSDVSVDPVLVEPAVGAVSTEVIIGNSAVAVTVTGSAPEGAVEGSIAALNDEV